MQKTCLFLLSSLCLFSSLTFASNEFDNPGFDDLICSDPVGAIAYPSLDDEYTIEILNSDHNFGIKPTFELHLPTSFSRLSWQISIDEDFTSTIYYQLDDCTDTLSLSDEALSYLKDGETYYFRVKGTLYDYSSQWSQWSTPFAFTLSKAAPTLYRGVSKTKPSTPYIRNPYVSEELWKTLSPYFLPEHLPEKAALDEIFSKRRVLNSKSSMEKSGFLILTKNHVIVAKHSKLPGYLIKVYFDDDDVVEWDWWLRRIQGVKMIQDCIDRHGYQGIMKTPKKWIYPLPAEPSPKDGKTRRNFVLVVEEVDILDSHDNRKAYKKKMNPDILNAFYTVIMENLLIDSVYADNAPFCKDGRLAFIDTEHVMDRTRPVEITHVAMYLSSEMYSYWEQLVVHGGPR